MFTQYSQIPSNTLLKKYATMMESFYSSQKYTKVEGICGDIPGLSLKIRTSKQPIREIPGYEIIPSYPLKYPRTKQGLTHLTSTISYTVGEVLLPIYFLCFLAIHRYDSTATASSVTSYS
jgi:hypothetical protein